MLCNISRVINEDRNAIPVSLRCACVGRQCCAVVLIVMVVSVLATGLPVGLTEAVGDQEKSTVGEKAGKAIQWPDDYPTELRERKWDLPVQLVGPKPAGKQAPKAKVNTFGGARAPIDEAPEAHVWDVLWARRLAGKGQFEMRTEPSIPKFGQLLLQPVRPPVARDKAWTFLALDDDLERRWFEYAQVVQTYQVDPSPRPGLPDEVVRGLFFGWKRTAPGKFETYLVMMPFKEDPVQRMPFRRITIGRAVFQTDGDEPALVVMRSFLPVAGKDFPTKKLELEKTTPTIRVRAVPGKVRITENDTELIEFSPPEDPRGPLGIFVKDRPTFFYRGTITALKE